MTLLFFEWSNINKCKASLALWEDQVVRKSCSKKWGAEKQVGVVDWNISRVAN